jgi:uncharacterized protein
MSIHLTAAAVVAAFAAAAAGAGAQAVTGFGFSLVAAPIFVQLLGPARAVRWVNLLAVAVNLLILTRDRRHVRPTYALRLLVPAALVTPLVAYAVHRAPAAGLSIVVGLLITASALVLASGRRSARLNGPAGMVVAGGLSGAMNTASGVGGPTVAMYALNAEWPIDMTRPTLQLYFLGLNLLSFIALGGVSLAVRDLAVLLSAIVIGFSAGSVAARRLSAGAVGRAVLAFSVAGGLAAIVRGLSKL